MKYDLIIVARSSTPRLIQMTQNCIDSAVENAAGHNCIILVETSGEWVQYGHVDVYVPYLEAFNYHKALNMGLRFAQNDVHILANNDLIFYDWKSIGDDMLNNGFDSASAWFKGSRFPQGDFIYEGYEVAVHLTGWCIFITKEALRKIGKLDESVDFWYSDNLYADQLKANGLRHGLFCNVRVDHIANQTLNTMPVKIKRQYSLGQLAKYNHANRERV